MIITQKLITFLAGFWMFFLFMTASANAYEFQQYRGMTLKIIGNITANYSNNVTYASDNERKTEAFRTMLDLGLDFEYIGKRRSMGFYGTLKRQIHSSASNVRNPSENLRLYYRDELTKYDSIYLTNTFSHTQEPGNVTGGFNMEECRNFYKDSGLTTTEIEFLCNEFNEEFGSLRGKYDRNRNTFDITYNKELSKELRLSTGYSHNLTWTDLESGQDTSQDTLKVNAHYTKELNRYSLSYSYSESGKTNIQNVSAGIRRDLTKHLYVNVTAGLSMSSIGGVKYTNENYSVSLGNEILINNRTSATINFSRRMQIRQDREGIFDNWRVSANLRRDILKELIGNVTYFYGEGSYLSTNEKDEFQGASVRLTYLIWEGKKSQRINGRLGYTYSQLVSNVENRDYQRSTADLGIVAQF